MNFKNNSSNYRRRPNQHFRTGGSSFYRQNSKKSNFKKRLPVVALFLLVLIFTISTILSSIMPTKDMPTPDYIGSIPVHEDYLREDHPNRPKQKRKVKYVVIHETGNFSKGSTAKSHNEYIKKSTDRAVSWHYTVDDKEIYHHIPDNEVAWHAGDQLKNPGGNLNGISIEMCVNADGNFEKTKKNGAKLTAYLLHTYNLKISDVKQHGDFIGKNCPQTIRDNNQWDDFLNDVSQELVILKQTTGQLEANEDLQK